MSTDPVSPTEHSISSLPPTNIVAVDTKETHVEETCTKDLLKKAMSDEAISNGIVSFEARTAEILQTAVNPRANDGQPGSK
jgi:hypothetical protein